MSEDARFEDGGEKPLRLSAQDSDDLKVISTLLQDAVFPITEMSWQPTKRRFALLLNRFRWEDRDQAQLRGRKPERVQSMVVVGDVLAVASHGIERGDKDTILSILSLEFVAGEELGGQLEITLAGDGAIRLTVECLDVSLVDVTRPYLAPSGSVPHHKE